MNDRGYDLTGLTQACDCLNWSCGLPPCAECGEDHGGLERQGRRLCRDCWQDEMMNAIAERLRSASKK